MTITETSSAKSTSSPITKKPALSVSEIEERLAALAINVHDWTEDLAAAGHLELRVHFPPFKPSTIQTPGLSGEEGSEDGLSDLSKTNPDSSPPKRISELFTRWEVFSERNLSEAVFTPGAKTATPRTDSHSSPRPVSGMCDEYEDGESDHDSGSVAEEEPLDPYCYSMFIAPTSKE